MAICDALLDYYLPNQVQRERAHRDLMARDGLKDSSRLGLFKAPSRNGALVAAAVAAAAAVAGPGLGSSTAAAAAAAAANGDDGTGGEKGGGEVGGGGGGNNGIPGDGRGGEQGGEARDVDDEVSAWTTIDPCDTYYLFVDDRATSSETSAC